MRYIKGPIFEQIRCLTVLAVLFLSAQDTFSFSMAQIIDDIQITEITDMHLRKEKGLYYLDVVFTIEHAGKKPVKLEQCNFSLAFDVKDTDDIKLGTTFTEYILLKPSTNSSPSKNDMRLTVNIGNDIEQLFMDISESDDLNALIMVHAPKLTVHLVGQLHVGRKSKMGWTYSSNLEIDWRITAKVPRKSMLDTFKKIQIYTEMSLAKGDNDVDMDELRDQIDELDRKKEVTKNEALLGKKFYIHFKWGQLTLNERNKKKIADFTDTVGKTAIPDGWTLHIHGHTDLDKYPNNKGISKKRAVLVKNYLTNEEEFIFNNIDVRGFGEEKPLVQGNDKKASTKNRRVELYFSTE